jgi:tetratricopeptide (TPR) repeat protein
LKELAREESEPKVLPMVMAAWGIDLDGVDGDIFSDNWWEIFDPSAAYVNWLVVHDDLGEHREAIEGYNRAIALDPNDREAYRNRGVARGKLSAYGEAIEDFERALDPNDSAAYFNRGLAHYHLNEYHEAINEHHEAIEDYDHGIALDPDESAAYCMRGLAHGDLNEYREAIEDYDRTIALDTTDTNDSALYALACQRRTAPHARPAGVRGHRVCAAHRHPVERLAPGAGGQLDGA